MSTIYRALFNAILKESSSVEQSRDAIKKAVENIESRHQAIDEKIKKAKKDAKRGARLTNHRFSI
ncbi:hypothetical protein [Kerstersia similis]|uniref:hypothetical protein n=1 Tax=Kerstersia similis TaxID=206505 RepID=UPI0039F072E7